MVQPQVFQERKLFPGVLQLNKTGTLRKHLVNSSCNLFLIDRDLINIVGGVGSRGQAAYSGLG